MTKAKPAASPKAKGSKARKPGKRVDDEAAGRGDRSKRLLDLVMLLLRARSPVTYREIKDQFVAYQTLNVDAGLRAFERDKADLLDLGVPIRYITPDEDDALEDGGYVIDLKRFPLPEVRLTTDEVSALVLAASIAHAMPGGTYPKIVDLALKKLAFDVPEAPDTPTEFLSAEDPVRDTNPRSTVLVHFPDASGSRGGRRGHAPTVDLGEIFAELEAATRFRKRVSITYQTANTGQISRRDVDPYAMVYRDSTWLLVGWCHLRVDIRSFRVDRMQQAVMAARPKSPDFERPVDFDIKRYTQRSPWTFASEPVEDVELVLSAEAADVGNEDFGPAASVRRTGDDIVIRFLCGNPEFAVSRVLAAKGAIRVAAGPELLRRLTVELAAIASRYAEPGAAP